jgi:hypothetical protein
VDFSFLRGGAHPDGEGGVVDASRPRLEEVSGESSILIGTGAGTRIRDAELDTLASVAISCCRSHSSSNISNEGEVDAGFGHT